MLQLRNFSLHDMITKMPCTLVFNLWWKMVEIVFFFSMKHKIAIEFVSNYRLLSSSKRFARISRCLHLISIASHTNDNWNIGFLGIKCLKCRIEHGFDHVFDANNLCHYLNAVLYRTLCTRESISKTIYELSSVYAVQICFLIFIDEMVTSVLKHVLNVYLENVIILKRCFVMHFNSIFTSILAAAYTHKHIHQ